MDDSVASPRSVEAIARAEQDLFEDHRGLHGLFTELETVTDVARIDSVLGELQPLLRAHFEREELPGGLYDRLGVLGDEYAVEVRRLVDDHFRFISKAQSLRRAIGSVNRSDESVIGEARDLAQALRAHEKLEHQLATRAREAAG